MDVLLASVSIFLIRLCHEKRQVHFSARDFSNGFFFSFFFFSVN